MKQDLHASGGTATNLEQVRLAGRSMTFYPWEVRREGKKKKEKSFLGSFPDILVVLKNVSKSQDVFGYRSFWTGTSRPLSNI